jgi:hypothetical protein
MSAISQEGGAFGVSAGLNQLGHVSDQRRVGFGLPGGLDHSPSMGARQCSTNGQSADPMPFPRIPEGDTISVISHRLRCAERFVNDLLRRQF